jgi:hypothetical protein
VAAGDSAVGGLVGAALVALAGAVSVAGTGVPLKLPQAVTIRPIPNKYTVRLMLLLACTDEWAAGSFDRSCHPPTLIRFNRFLVPWIVPYFRFSFISTDSASMISSSSSRLVFALNALTCSCTISGGHISMNR